MFSRWPINRRVVVNLIDGRAFDGVLFQRRGPLLVLRDARLLEGPAEPIPIDGEVIVERPQVSFIQARL